MDRETLKQDLARAKRRLAQSKRQAASQRRVIEKLEQDGHIAARARAVLDVLLRTQARHERDRGFFSLCLRAPEGAQ